MVGKVGPFFISEKGLSDLGRINHVRGQYGNIVYRVLVYVNCGVLARHRNHQRFLGVQVQVLDYFLWLLGRRTHGGQQEHCKD